MTTATQKKGKRSLEITLGFFNGATAFNADGSGKVGATLFEVTGRPGDWSADEPGETDMDPLDRGYFDPNTAPFLVDDQNCSGAFNSYYTHETDPNAVGLMDILYNEASASVLPSVIANSEKLYCDMRVKFTHPANAADTHGAVYQQVRLTHNRTVGDPVVVGVNWKARQNKPGIRF